MSNKRADKQKRPVKPKPDGAHVGSFILFEVVVLDSFANGLLTLGPCMSLYRALKASHSIARH